MKRVLVDTDILSYFFKGDENVVGNFERYFQENSFVEISIITYYEIVSGLLAKEATKQLELFYMFMENNLVIPVTENSARISAQLYSELRKGGNSLDDIDLLIAGIAIENDLIIVTNNEKHFGRINNLKIQNWKTAE